MEWLGYISAILHLCLINTVVILIIVTHTICTSLYLKVILFSVLLVIVIQHLILGDCVMNVFERRITGQSHPPFRQLVEKILFHFNITLEEYDRHSVMIEALSVLWLGLEILSIVCSSITL